MAPVAERCLCWRSIFDALHSVPSGSDTIQERHITFASFLMYANTLKAEFVAGVKLQPHVAFLESMNLLSSPQSDKAASMSGPASGYVPDAC